MTKNLLKKLLGACVLVPCLTVATACGKSEKKDNDDDDLPPTQQPGGEEGGEQGGSQGGQESTTTEAEKAAAFNVLKGIATDFVNKENKQLTIETVMSDTQKMEVNDPENKMDATKKAQIDQMLASMGSASESREEITYDLVTGQFHSIYEDDCVEDECEWTEEEWVVKNGEVYTLYNKDAYGNGDEYQSAYYVGADYTEKGALKYYLGVDSSAIGFLTLFEDYDDLKANFLNKFGYMTDGELPLQGVTPEFSMEKDGDVYTLGAVMNAKGMEVEMYDMPMTVDMNIEFEFKFDSEKLISCTSNSVMTTVLEMPAETFGLVGDPISVLMTMSNDENATFNATFDAAAVAKDFTNWIEGEIGPNRSYLSYYLNDGNVGSGSFLYGENLELLDLAEELPGLDVTWYLDKDCTIPATSVTKVPSYDLVMYGKINAIPAGKALVIAREKEYASGELYLVDAGNVDFADLFNDYGGSRELVAISVNGDDKAGTTFEVTAQNIYEIIYDTIDVEPEEKPGENPGENPGDNPGGEGLATEEEKAAAFDILKQIASNFVNQEYEKMTIVSNFTNRSQTEVNDPDNTVDPEIKDMLNAEFASNNEDYRYEEETTYDLATGQYYGSYKNDCEDDVCRYVEEEWVVKNGEEYILYGKDANNYGSEISKAAYKVDEIYTAMGPLSSVLGVDDSAVGFLTMFEDYEDLKNNFTTKFSEMTDGEMPIEGVVPSFTMEYKDGIYNVGVVLTAENMYVENEGMPMYINMQARIEFVFNEEGLISSTSSNVMVGNFELPGEAFGIDGVIPVVMTRTNYDVVTYNYEFDSAKHENNFENWVDGAIENRGINITYKINGNYYLNEGSTFGEELTLIDLSERVEGLNVTWYLDEACTIPASTLVTTPSYDITVYAKVEAAPEGKALIMAKADKYSSADLYLVDAGNVDFADLFNDYGGSRVLVGIEVNGEVKDGTTFEAASTGIYELIYTVEYNNGGYIEG